MTAITIWRVLVFSICAISFLIMIVGFARHSNEWNVKTRDYWYSRVMWTVVGMSATLEGIIRHTSFRYSIIFLTAAALATLKANVQRGPWGGGRDR